MKGWPARFARFLRRHSGSLLTLRMIFRQADNVVEITGRQDDKLVHRLPRRDLLCGLPDPTKMCRVMRGIGLGIMLL